MTCVVGIEHEGIAYLAGDTLGADGWAEIDRTDAKVFTRQTANSDNGACPTNVAFGFTTSYRMGQLLHHVLDMPAGPHGEIEAWLVRELIPAVRSCLTDNGYTKIDSNREENGDFIVGVHGEVWRIASDLQVGRSRCGYAAVGSGYLAALGALHALEHGDHDAPTRAIMAIKAAAYHTQGVGGQIDMVAAGVLDPAAA